MNEEADEGFRVWPGGSTTGKFYWFTVGGGSEAVCVLCLYFSRNRAESLEFLR